MYVAHLRHHRPRANSSNQGVLSMLSQLKEKPIKISRMTGKNCSFVCAILTGKHNISLSQIPTFS